jgi:hypothetical protein
VSRDTSTEQWITATKKKIDTLRPSLSVERDVTGLLHSGREAAQRLHDAGKLFGDAKYRFELSKAHFDIWMAKRRRAVKAKLLKEFCHRLGVWEFAPRKTRGPKPEEPKETDIKDFIMSTRTYREWREELAGLISVLELAEKASFKPCEVKSHLIMNMNKVLTRDNPE